MKHESIGNSGQSGEGVRDDATARAVFGWMLAAVVLLAALVVVLLILHAGGGR